jgi:peptidyl-tRNA hydrolase
MRGAIKKIVLKCPQIKLEELESKNYIAVRDNGLTQLEPNTLTVVTLGILRENEVESWVKELKLL